LEAKAAQAALYEAEKRGADALRGELREERKEGRDLRKEVEKLGHQVELARDEVARLRGVPVNTVAVALGYTGIIGKRENAIDLVKRIGGLEYPQAVAWLAHAFGPETAAEAVRDTLAKTPPQPVLTKPDQVKAKAIAEQLDALAAPAYRVTLMRNVDGDQVGQNLGKRENEPEKFWDRNEILGMIPKLTAQNAQGANVFITPIDPSARHVLIDDLSRNDLAELAQRSYQPATITQTSRGNYQAILKVGTDLDEQATNEWFKAMNRELGDEKITGLRHPFRLAGFQNRKDKHEQPGGRFPFVEVVHAVNQFCETARRVIIEMARQFRQDEPPSPPPKF
jgi:hypothetical protein